jgi:hypothetical protein
MRGDVSTGSGFSLIATASYDDDMRSRIDRSTYVVGRLASQPCDEALPEEVLLHAVPVVHSTNWVAVDVCHVHREVYYTT